MFGQGHDANLLQAPELVPGCGTRRTPAPREIRDLDAALRASPHEDEVESGGPHPRQEGTATSASPRRRRGTPGNRGAARGGGDGGGEAQGGGTAGGGALTTRGGPRGEGRPTKETEGETQPAAGRAREGADRATPGEEAGTKPRAGNEGGRMTITGGAAGSGAPGAAAGAQLGPRTDSSRSNSMGLDLPFHDDTPTLDATKAARNDSPDRRPLPVHPRRLPDRLPMGTCCSLRGKAAADNLDALGETSVCDAMHDDMDAEDALRFARRLRACRRPPRTAVRGPIGQAVGRLLRRQAQRRHR